MLTKGILRWRVLAGIIAKWGATTVADDNIFLTRPGGVILLRFLVLFAFCQYLHRTLANLAPFASVWLQTTAQAVAVCCKMRFRLMKIFAKTNRYVSNKLTAWARSLKIGRNIK